MSAVCHLLPPQELLNWLADWLLTFQQKTSNAITILFDVPKRDHLNIA